MAKAKGIISFDGTLGGITFYTFNGKQFARRKSSLDKERVLSDPNFENSRKRAMEFGACARLSKTIRQSLTSAGMEVFDRHSHNRLTEALRRRAADPDFNGILNFNTNTQPTFSLNNESAELITRWPGIDSKKNTWIFNLPNPEFFSKSSIPTSAEYIRFGIGLTAISKLQRQSDASFTPFHPNLHGVSIVAFTPFLPINQDPNRQLILKPDKNFPAHPDLIFLLTTSIEFFIGPINHPARLSCKYAWAKLIP